MNVLRYAICIGILCVCFQAELVPHCGHNDAFVTLDLRYDPSIQFINDQEYNKQMLSTQV